MSLGGPEHVIQVKGRRIRFEMHPYCGPVALRKDGEPAKQQPKDFLHAASLWAQQGRKVDPDGVCIWRREPEPILKHLGGRHWKIIGYKEPEIGS